MSITIRRSKIEPTHRCTFDSISPDATKPITLIVKHAGETNPAYWSDVMKDVSGSASSSVGAARPGEDAMQAIRVDHADRFARTVVIDWENVLDQGVPVTCTPAAAREFFDMLIAPGEESYRDVFDRFVATCRNIDTFRAPIADPVVLGKK